MQNPVLVLKQPLILSPLAISVADFSADRGQQRRAQLDQFRQRSLPQRRRLAGQGGFQARDLPSQMQHLSGQIAGRVLRSHAAPPAPLFTGKGAG